MYSITKTFKFEAAHQLQDWPELHQCSRLHGHSYELTVEMVGASLETSNKPSVIEDYGDISACVKKYIVSKWDHQNLNEVLNIRNTTAEILAMLAFNILIKHLPQLNKVTVCETSSSSASYYR